MINGPSRTGVAAREAESGKGQRASFNLGEREILPSYQLANLYRPASSFPAKLLYPPHCLRLLPSPREQFAEKKVGRG